jgi:general stress protein YciG
MISGRRALPRGTVVALVGLETTKENNAEQDRGGGPREANVAKEDRGFASMDRAKQREIASKGGKAAHQKGTAHEWTSEEARDAGRKGGIASHQRRREQLGGSDEGTPSGSASTDSSDVQGTE